MYIGLVAIILAILSSCIVPNNRPQQLESEIALIHSFFHSSSQSNTSAYKRRSIRCRIKRARTLISHRGNKV